MPVIVLVFVGQSYITNQTVSERNETTGQESRSFSAPTLISASATPTVEEVSVVIDFGNGKKLEGQVAGKTAYEVLENLVKEKNLEVRAKQYKYGLLVEKIAEYEGSSTYAWMYSVNGKAGRIAADRYQVKPNDKIDWKFEKFSQ